MTEQEFLVWLHERTLQRINEVEQAYKDVETKFKEWKTQANKGI